MSHHIWNPLNGTFFSERLEVARSSDGSWARAKASKSTDGTSGNVAELIDGLSASGVEPTGLVGRDRVSATTFRSPLMWRTSVVYSEMNDK